MEFTGTIIKRGNDYFVITEDRRVSQKVYPLYKGSYSENKEIDFEIIPINSESDEQTEYIARPVLINLTDEME